MPSDAKKREQQRKKDQAKARSAGKKGGNDGKKNDGKEQSPAPDKVTNGSSIETNGTDLSIEGSSYKHFKMVNL